MTWNRFLYNSALWNAGREEAPGIIKSIISAHTGPHVIAAIGSSGGTTLISDFVITEGTVKKPPTQYKFPDMAAWIRAYQIQPSSEGTAGGFAKDDLATFIRAQQFKDLPACVFLVNQLPNLPASIFGLFQYDLSATIAGFLAQLDLAAILYVVGVVPTPVAGGPADLSAFIRRIPDRDLRAIIWSPKDLRALLEPVQFLDLPASIRGFQFADLPARMLGVPTPQFIAFIRGMEADIKNLPARALPLSFNQGMPTSISPVFTGDTGFKVGLPAQIGSSGGYDDILTIIKSVVEAIGDLGALIKTGGEVNLPAIIQLLGGDNLSAIIGTIPAGERDRILNAFAQSLHPADLGALMTISTNVKFLGAIIESLRDTKDLGAFIRVAETFVTAILTISTLASRNLRATIGRPDCQGGSGNYNMSALAITQHAKSITAFIQSFIEKNLGASINNTETFFAYDTIDVRFSPFILPVQPKYFVTDTIPVLFSSFRGKNLGAAINIIQNNVFLGASITAVFPLPRVVPAINRLTALDLRVTEPQNIQEVRLQLEGSLLEYIYVNGTDQSFIKDSNEDWKINIRSFKPIAAGLFGDHAAAKICRLGSLVNFHTMDEAVRFCIQTVLGFESRSDFGATIAGTGGIDNLSAFLEVQNHFGDLMAFASRVFPMDLGAATSGTGGYLGLSGFIHPTGSGIMYNLGATIEDLHTGESALSGTIVVVS